MARTNEESAVQGVLARMDRAERRMKLTLYGAAGIEGLLMIMALLLIDWTDRTQILLFTFSTLGYTIVALGLIAVSLHVSRVGARVVAALDRERVA